MFDKKNPKKSPWGKKETGQRGNKNEKPLQRKKTSFVMGKDKTGKSLTGKEDKKNRIPLTGKTKKIIPGLGKKKQSDAAFQGKLAIFNPGGTAHLFRLVENIRATGVLELTNEDEKVDIYFFEGKLVFAETVHNKIKIGTLLVRKGLVSKEQAQEALDIFNEEGGERKIGEILIDLGYIDNEPLQKAVLSQIKLAIASTMLWEGGEFTFRADVKPPVEDVVMDINVQLLIIEVMKHSHTANSSK